MSDSRFNFFGALCVGMSFLAVAYSIGYDTKDCGTLGRDMLLSEFCRIAASNKIEIEVKYRG